MEARIITTPTASPRQHGAQRGCRSMQCTFFAVSLRRPDAITDLARPNSAKPGKGLPLIPCMAMNEILPPGQVQKFHTENASWKQVVVLLRRRTCVCRATGNCHPTADRAVDFTHLPGKPAKTHRVEIQNHSLPSTGSEDVQMSESWILTPKPPDTAVNAGSVGLSNEHSRVRPTCARSLRHNCNSQTFLISIIATSTDSSSKQNNFPIQNEFDVTTDSDPLLPLIW